MGMNYTTQWIVYLADDLKQNADWLQEKRGLEGDLRGSINSEVQSRTQVTRYPLLPASTALFSRSRLIILGHGNPASTHIMGNGKQWTAQEFAALVDSWLETTVSRISLHMCYGGGNLNAGEEVKPEASFAYHFASHCNYAQTITARTATTNMVKRTGETTQIWRETGDAHKGTLSKVVFTPQGGTPNKAVPPAWRYVY
jgi:hypothetical protein